jgi:RND family efflux transporter MFP subunit
MFIPRNKRIFFNLITGIIFVLWISPLWAGTVEYDGLIEPYVVIDIGTPSEGIAVKVLVDRSSPIKKGQTLVALESSLERAALEKALAMATFDGEIRLQQTQLSFAKRVYERIKPLAAISAHDKDQAATKIILTEYRLKKARENNTLAKLEVERARAMLARRSINAPISGVVVDRYVSPGEYVKSQPLFKVAQINPLRVEVIIPAEMFDKITPGMTATIAPELSAYGEHTATVQIVDKIIDSASNTFGARLELPNIKHQLPAGLKCLVRFEIDDILGVDSIEGVKEKTPPVIPGQVLMD